MLKIECTDGSTIKTETPLVEFKDYGILYHNSSSGFRTVLFYDEIKNFEFKGIPNEGQINKSIEYKLMMDHRSERGKPSIHTVH